MKKIILLLIMITPILALAQKGDFILNGKIEHVNAPSKAYISYLIDGESVMDSAVINKGTFTFKGTVNGPVLARITIANNEGEIKSQRPGPAMLSASLMDRIFAKNSRIITNEITIYLEPGKINLTTKDSLQYASIRGSKLNDQQVDYLKYIAVPYAKLVSVLTTWFAASEEKRKDVAFDTASETEYKKASDELKVKQLAYIKTNPDSYFSLLALSESILGKKLDFIALEPIYKSLSAQVRATELGVMFAQAIEDAR